MEIEMNFMSNKIIENKQLIANYLYDNGLKFIFNEKIIHSPVFTLPLEHYFLHYLIVSFIIYLPSKPRKYVYTPIAILHLIYSPINKIVNRADQLSILMQNFVLTQLFNMTINLLMFEEIEKTDFKKDRKIEDGKLYWAFDRCSVNLRGIGWNFQMKNVPEASNDGFIKFVILKIMFYEIGFKYILYEIAGYIYEHNGLGMGKISMMLSVVMQIYFGFNLMYWIACVSSVSFGFSNVKDWPDMFQMFKGDKWSMQVFWSIWWHQYLSRDSYLLSKRIFGNIRNKNLRRMMLIMGTFIICGIIHAIGSLNLDWDGGKKYNDDVPNFIPLELNILNIIKLSPNRCFYSMLLFIWSGIIVLIEGLIKRFIGEFNNKPLSILWMIIVQCYPVLMYIGELKAGGLEFPKYMAR